MIVHFIGAGPGAPDLITVRGLKQIKSCPVILYAGSLVPPEIVAEAAPNARVRDTAPLIRPGQGEGIGRCARSLRRPLDLRRHRGTDAPP